MSRHQLKRGQRALLERSTILDEVDSPPLARLAVAFGALVLAMFLAWASLAVVEEVAQAPGTVGSSAEEARIEHPTGGVVTDILVREGSPVEAGQVLLRLDPVDSEAAIAQSLSQRESLRAQAVRLRALLEGRKPYFTEEGPDSAMIIADQRRLYQLELDLVAAKEAVLVAQEAQQKSAREAIGIKLDEVRRQLALAKEERQIREGLASGGIVSRTDLIAIERQVASLEAESLSLSTERRKTEEALEELDARRAEYLSSRLKAYSDELAAVNDRLSLLDDSARRLEHGARSLELAAPIAGTVLGLTVKGRGEVLRAGETLATIIPRDPRRLAELRVSPRDIGAVVPGLPVRLKVSAYPFDRYGGFKGTIEEVSPSTFIGPDGGSYYRATAVVEGRELVSSEDLPLIPGMTLTADIVTGDRTVLQYILKPIFASAREAFRER